MTVLILPATFYQIIYAEHELDCGPMGQGPYVEIEPLKLF